MRGNHLAYAATLGIITGLLKSIETVREIIVAKILYINTGIFIRSVDLFLCLRIRFTISSGGEQKNEFSTGAPRKFNEDIFG